MIANVHEPPYVAAHLAGIGGAIGSDVEDFRVDEVPAYAPSGAGEHVYVRIEKRALTTPEAVRRIAEAAHVDARDIGYAGLKDKRAVTTQWLSLPSRAAPASEWPLPEAIRVLETSRHNNKLRTGHLSGNLFRVVLSGVEPDALERAQAILAHLSQHGVPNYFGGQRFGRGGENLSRALAWLESGGRARLSPFLLKLYPSVVQSEIFNRYLTRRSELGLTRVFSGEVMRLDGSSASFVAEDAERESARLVAGEIHLTGPMLGPKMRAASGVGAELEIRARETLTTNERVLETLAKFAPGARRDLVVKPANFRLVALDGGRLLLEFGLPSGSYATVVAREFTRAPLLADLTIEGRDNE